MGTMFLSHSPKSGLHSLGWVLPGAEMTFLTDVRCHNSFYPSPPFPPSLCSSSQVSFHQTSWEYVEGTFLVLEKRKETRGGGVGES
jgi:hypothetical protein